MTTNTLRRMLLVLPLLLACITSCSGSGNGTQPSSQNTKNNSSETMTNPAPADKAPVTVDVKTTMGDFTIMLYDDTPLHRDNFVKLVDEGYYDGTLFHRVINEFMIQAGDPDSKNAAPGAALGSGGPGYTIDAEIVFPRHFHKRGALAAARQGDQVNPQKRSSGSQFYVVTGRKVPQGQLAQLETSLKNNMMQSHFNGLVMKHRDEITAMQKAGDREGLMALQEKLIAETEKAAADQPSLMTDEMRKAYTETGGAPHLDGAYTVFGEVIKGMDVIDRIEKVETDGRDRPKEDVKIISMKIVR